MSGADDFASEADARAAAVYDATEDAVREGVAVGDLDARGRVYDVPAGFRVCPLCDGWGEYQGGPCGRCGERGWTRV